MNNESKYSIKTRPEVFSTLLKKKEKKRKAEKPFKRLINFNSVSCLANFIANNHSFLDAKTENTIMSVANSFPLKFFVYINCDFWLLAVVGLF